MISEIFFAITLRKLLLHPLKRPNPLLDHLLDNGRLADGGGFGFARERFHPHFERGGEVAVSVAQR